MLGATSVQAQRSRGAFPLPETTFVPAPLATPLLAPAGTRVALPRIAQPVRIGPAPAVKNIVLVHGAFMDALVWAKVITVLQAQRHHVTAVQLPLTSLAADIAATNRALAVQQGPVIRVGHSWGGVVITEAGMDPKVAGLVYVAAFAPDRGEVVGDLGERRRCHRPGLRALLRQAHERRDHRARHEPSGDALAAAGRGDHGRGGEGPGRECGT